MEKIKKYFMFLAVYAAAILGLYFFKPGGDYFVEIVRFVNYLSAFVALFFGYQSIKYFGLKSLQGKSTLFVTLAVLAWLLGDFFWDISGDAVVSLGDFFFFSYYPLLGIGIILGIKTVSPDFFSNKKRVAALGLASVVLSLIYFNFFPVSWDYEISFLENVVTYGYTISDFFLLIFVVLIISLVVSGIYSKAWITIGGAAASFWIGNIIYVLTYDTYQSGDMTDLFWLFGYLIFAWGLILSKHNAEKLLGQMKPEPHLELKKRKK